MEITKQEYKRLCNIEVAAKVWWNARGRYNPQLAACKLAELLGYAP